MYDKDKPLPETAKLTISGAIVDYANIEHSEFRIIDIIYALSNINRYNGHLYTSYTVAHHSIFTVLIAQQILHHINPETLLCILLHDAAEAYTGDIITPFKRMFPTFELIEKEILERIMTKLEIDDIYWNDETQRVIKEVDSYAFLAERITLFNNVLNKDYYGGSVEPFKTQACLRQLNAINARESRVIRVYSKMETDEITVINDCAKLLDTLRISTLFTDIKKTFMATFINLYVDHNADVLV
jgi:hypothetical protein